MVDRLPSHLDLCVHSDWVAGVLIAIPERPTTALNVDANPMALAKYDRRRHGHSKTEIARATRRSTAAAMRRTATPGSGEPEPTPCYSP